MKATHQEKANLLQEIRHLVQARGALLLATRQGSGAGPGTKKSGTYKSYNPINSIRELVSIALFVDETDTKGRGEDSF